MAKPKGEYRTDKKYGVTYGPALATPVGRATFVRLAKPVPDQYGTNVWKMSVIFSKKDKVAMARLKRMEIAAEACCIAKYKTKERVPKTMAPAVRDADEDERILEYEGFKGSMYVELRNRQGCPLITGETEDEVLEPSEIKPGMKVQAWVSPVVSKNGIAWNLEGVRLVEDDGKRFGHKASNTKLYGEDDIDEANEVVKKKSKAVDEDEDETEEEEEEAPPVKKGKRAAVEAEEEDEDEEPAPTKKKKPAPPEDDDEEEEVEEPEEEEEEPEEEPEEEEDETPFKKKKKVVKKAKKSKVTEDEDEDAEAEEPEEEEPEVEEDLDDDDL